MKLFQKLNEPSFAEIQKELIENIPYDKLSSMKDAIYSQHFDIATLPVLNKFITERSKVEILSAKMNFTIPQFRWKAHIDGTNVKNCSQVALNIPILHYENSINRWFSLGNNKILTGGYGYHKTVVNVIEDESKCTLIEETVIDTMALMRTDVFHSVENCDLEKVRINLIIRFPVIPNIRFEDVFEFRDIKM